MSLPAPLQAFNNAAARDSQNPNPLIGQSCILIDTGEFLIYYGPSLGWCKPWNQGWGEVARAQIDGAVAAPNTNGAVAPEDCPPVPGLVLDHAPLVQHRQYEFRFEGSITSDNDGDIVQLGIAIKNNEDGTAFSQSQAFVVHDVGVAPEYVQFGWKPGYLASVSYNLYMVAAQISGTGALVYADVNFPSCLYITDVGPNGNPVYN